MSFAVKGEENATDVSCEFFIKFSIFKCDAEVASIDLAVLPEGNILSFYVCSTVVPGLDNVTS